MLWSAIASKDGASLTAFTVTIKIWLSERGGIPLSVTVMVKTSEPFQSSSIGSNSIEEPEIVALIFSPLEISYNISVTSSSFTRTLIERVLPSSNEMSDINSIDGASFTPSTVTVKVWSWGYSPSVTVAVNSSLPFQSSSITLKVTVDPSIDEIIFVPSVIV